MPPLPTLTFLPTCPQPSPDPPSFQSTPLATPPDSLPIDEVEMPEDDVSDLRDVYDAINRLCETMRTSVYEDTESAEEAEEAPLRNIEETITGWDAPAEASEYASDTDVAGSLLDVMGYASDTDVTSGSLLGDAAGYVSDTEVAVQWESSARGHVAAMRERYENMSRSHTPADFTDTPR